MGLKDLSKIPCHDPMDSATSKGILEPVEEGKAMDNITKGTGLNDEYLQL